MMSAVLIFTLVGSFIFNAPWELLLFTFHNLTDSFGIKLIFMVFRQQSVDLLLNIRQLGIAESADYLGLIHICQNPVVNLRILLYPAGGY